MDVTLPGGVEVTLRPTLGFREAASIRNEIILLRQADPDASVGDILAVLTEGYILHGIEAWSLTDDDGKPLPVTKGNIRARLLSDLTAASILGDHADELYAEAVMLPLLAVASNSSPDTPTEASTSAPTDSSSTRRKPSRPSSISTIPTADTEGTSESPDGDSSSSPSSTSAA